MVLIIALLNRSILKPSDQINGYNCRVTSRCSLQHKCLTSGIVHETTITNNKVDVEKIYGLCETSFKESYCNDINSFRYEKYKNEAELLITSSY